MAGILWDPVYQSLLLTLRSTYLLRILSDHEDELEIVHSQSDIVQLIDVGQEDDVFDGVFDDLGVVGYMISTYRDLGHSELTLQLEQESQGRLVICRLFTCVCGQYRFDVFDQILRFEQFAKSITDGVDFVGSSPSVLNT